ncbi:MAG TPA: PilX N-terminal domain-containing pilus assembly protein [Vicinamibacteria bacterium]|nr:PilX N-terminal domain-containing pilus assembly protein [Vicinamibacteria bacterium]
MRSRTTAALIAKESLLMRTNRSLHGTQSGFALVLALLALLLLTFLGLTLAVTTSTELQIATNYRWSEQARYVAEAGVEAGKIMLRETITWDNLLPVARGTPWYGNETIPTTPTGQAAARTGIRDWENGPCDGKGQGLGYGRVLDWNGAPQQYVNQFPLDGPPLNGSFTLWVRRPLHYLPDGSMVDWGTNLTSPVVAPADNDNLILVAEGIAPFRAMGGGSAPEQQMMNRAKATYVIEVALSHAPAVLGGCDSPLSGQQGKGPSGANFGGCEKLEDNAMDVAKAGSSSTGTGLALAGVR